MSCTAIVKDLGEIHARIFSSRPILQSEIAYFVREFEEKRKDREVEHLFTTLQNTTELRDGALLRCAALGRSHLPELGAAVDATIAECQQVLAFTAASQHSGPDRFEQQRADKRRQRELELERFAADVEHKRRRIDNTFEEKEEELREFYTDLACKLRGNI